MHRHLASLAALALLGAAACSKPAAPSDDLAKDLEAVSGPSVELAPRAAGTQIVSDIEQTPGSNTRAPSPRLAPKKVGTGTKRVARVLVDEKTPDAKPEVLPTTAPDPTTTVAVETKTPTPDGVIPTPRPRPADGPGEGHRRGGYSSVSDVIRRAPFPITP